MYKGYNCRDQSENTQKRSDIKALDASRDQADNCAAATKWFFPPAVASSVCAESKFSRYRGPAMPRPNRVAICLYLILSLVLTAAPAATAQTYTITDLGTF